VAGVVPDEAQHVVYSQAGASEAGDWIRVPHHLCARSPGGRLSCKSRVSASVLMTTFHNLNDHDTRDDPRDHDHVLHHMS